MTETVFMFALFGIILLGMACIAYKSFTNPDDGIPAGGIGSYYFWTALCVLCCFGGVILAFWGYASAPHIALITPGTFEASIVKFVIAVILMIAGFVGCVHCEGMRH